MNIETILQWLQLGTEHKYLLLAVAVIGWLTSLTSDWSKFPVTVPARWQPLVAALLGVAYGVLNSIQGGVAPWRAVVGGLVVGLATAGLYDAVVKSVFGGVVPGWLAWLSLGRKGSRDPLAGSPTVPPAIPAPPRSSGAELKKDEPPNT